MFVLLFKSNTPPTCLFLKFLTFILGLSAFILTDHNNLTFPLHCTEVFLCRYFVPSCLCSHAVATGIGLRKITKCPCMCVLTGVSGVGAGGEARRPKSEGSQTTKVSWEGGRGQRGNAAETRQLQYLIKAIENSPGQTQHFCEMCENVSSVQSDLFFSCYIHFFFIHESNRNQPENDDAIQICCFQNFATTVWL